MKDKTGKSRTDQINIKIKNSFSKPRSHYFEKIKRNLV